MTVCPLIFPWCYADPSATDVKGLLGLVLKSWLGGPAWLNAASANLLNKINDIDELFFALD